MEEEKQDETTQQQVIEQKFVEIDDLAKLDIRVGTVRFVEPVEGSTKLLRVLIDFGPEVSTMIYKNEENGQEFPVRQILSGIHPYYPNYSELVGKQLLYIINLKPRMMMGFESQGMLLAVGDNDCVFLVPEKEVESGSVIH